MSHKCPVIPKDELILDNTRVTGGRDEEVDQILAKDEKDNKSRKQADQTQDHAYCRPVVTHVA